MLSNGSSLFFARRMGAISCSHNGSLLLVCAKKGGKEAKPEARAVRPVPIKIVTVGKGNSSAAAAMAEEWLAKARRYTQVHEIPIKPNPKKASSPVVQVQYEGEKVLKSVAPGDKLIALDERGRAVKSEDVARLIARAGDDGCQALVFCIGGPYGHSESVRMRADETISLSSLVLNHQVAHIVLCEQIYRGWTILRGEPYHH
uniref:RNA methyltransferase n=1 Tax=Dunaliella tertiolecta TaxID=3047 RepID=A0A7S3VR79_DUNTE|mmetsp:Transcript_10277/g.28018  ORF Transcript_10277/g.28018 Transcript_10277/m.28018 type:complete len:202 (-) Transcript_10277:520-1125(-)